MKKFFTFILIVLLNIFFLLELNAAPDTDYYNFTGRYQLYNQVYIVEMYYNGALIEGSFYPKRTAKFTKKEFLIKLLIDGKKYVGSIFQNSPIMKSTFYELDLFCDNVPLKGEIVKGSEGKYRIDKIQLKFGTNNIDGEIKYPISRQHFSLSLQYGDKKITGVYNKKARDDYINLSIGDAKILGRIERTDNYDAFYIKTQAIGDINDIFLFLLFDICLKLDVFPENFDKSDSFR